MKNILIISAGYPFGKGESYLEPELEYAKDKANIFILPISASNTPLEHRALPDGVKLLLPKKVNYNRFLMILKSFFSVPMLAGILELLCGKVFAFSAVKELFKFIYASKVHYLTLKNTFDVDENTVVYSYWMNSLALTATYFKKRGCIAISRAHGADLYDHRTPFNHQFLRKYLIKKLDYVFPVSEDGVKHLKEKSKNAKNVIAMHLGTVDDGNGAYNVNDEVVIVSCAYAVKLKRIDLIIEALAKINFQNIRWVHFGGGPEFDKLKSMAEKNLKNIEFELRGDTPNSLVKDFYKNSNIKLFINVSETEGVPVSIMEALSFGIPVIATNVGGVSEMINEGYNGFLLPANPSSELIKDKIEHILSLSDDDYCSLRENSRKSFLESWESKKQFEKFYNFINKI